MPAAQDAARLLERKSTFESGCYALVDLLRAPGTAHEQLVIATAAAARAHTCLRARYTNPAFWRAGEALLKASIAVASVEPALRQQLPRLSACVEEVQSFLSAEESDGRDAEGSPGNQQQQQTLGELLLGLPPPLPRASHLTDAGIIIDTHPQQIVQQQPRQQQQQSIDMPLVSADELLAQLQRLPGLQQQQQQQQESESTQQSAQQQQHDAGSSDVPDAVTLERLAGLLPRAELEALLERITEVGGAGTDAVLPPRRPPAATHAVAALPRLVLTTAAQLADAAAGAGGSRCTVCLEPWALGDELATLPDCGHAFHASPCLTDWLARDNSCPCCRQELPSDDHRYEAAKEAAAEAAAEAAGAAAALSHNEFMYV